MTNNFDIRISRDTTAFLGEGHTRDVEAVDLTRRGVLSFPWQADVERYGLAPLHIHLGGEGLVTLFPYLDAVPSVGHLHHQSLVARRTSPAFPVNEHVRFARLHPDEERCPLCVSRGRAAVNPDC